MSSVLSSSLSSLVEIFCGAALLTMLGGVSVMFGWSEESTAGGSNLDRRFLATGVLPPSSVASVTVESVEFSDWSEGVSCPLLVNTFCMEERERCHGGWRTHCYKKEKLSNA